MGGGGGRVDSWIDTPKHALLSKTGFFQSEAAFSVQIFPWETEFMNNVLWSPRGAQARERTRRAGYTLGFYTNKIYLCQQRLDLQ